jgi:hypothetical protein
MADENSQRVDNQQRFALEFWLVTIMLGVLSLLVLAVLVWPVRATGTDGLPAKDLLQYRTNILSVIITAFGAWVGAGAAYFFGRENLRLAADSLLAMRDLSPKERLRRTSIKQIPPTPIDWMVKKTTSVNEVRDKLQGDPARWFVPIVRDDGGLETVINEEAVWRFLLANPGQPPNPLAKPDLPPEKQPGPNPGDPLAPPPAKPEPDKTPTADKTVEEILAFLETHEELRRFRQIHVSVAIGTTVGAANDLMDSKHVFLAIVETDGKPTHFFTTSEVRKLLLQSE